MYREAIQSSQTVQIQYDEWWPETDRFIYIYLITTFLRLKKFCILCTSMQVNPSEDYRKGISVIIPFMIRMLPFFLQLFSLPLTKEQRLYGELQRTIPSKMLPKPISLRIYRFQWINILYIFLLIIIFLTESALPDHLMNQTTIPEP